MQFKLIVLLTALVAASFNGTVRSGELGVYSAGLHDPNAPFQSPVYVLVGATLLPTPGPRSTRGGLVVGPATSK